MTKKTKFIHIGDLNSTTPPKHYKTDSWEIISPETVGAQKLAVFLSEMRPGGRTDFDSHPNSEHVFVVLSGRAKATVGKNEFTLAPNTCLFIPEDTPHRLEVVGREAFRTLVLFGPPLEV